MDLYKDDKEVDDKACKVDIRVSLLSNKAELVYLVAQSIRDRSDQLPKLQKALLLYTLQMGDMVQKVDRHIDKIHSKAMVAFFPSAF